MASSNWGERERGKNPTEEASGWNKKSWHLRMEQRKKLQNFIVFPAMNEGLTQHDGIHCTTRTELNQNLKTVKQSGTVSNVYYCKAKPKLLSFLRGRRPTSPL